MADETVTLHRDILSRVMVIVQALGAGENLDDVLELTARTVVDVLGFDAVAVNVRTSAGDLMVRTVIAPPELEQVQGGVIPHEDWLELLRSGESWGELCFLREPELDDSLPHLDPWTERLTPATDGEPWQPQFALLAPMWRAPGELLGVISVDLPRSGMTPDAEQRALLELFTSQAAAAIKRVHAFAVANDQAALYRAAFSASPAPTLVLDRELRIAEVNTAFLELADAIDGELDGKLLSEVIELDEFDRLPTRLARLHAGRSTVIADECRLNHPRGHQWDRWAHVAVQRVDSVTADDRYICIVSDRTSDRAAMSEMRRLAEHDDLTGLNVRAVGLRELARHGAELAAGRGAVAALVYCDLDNFKPVNDTSGHVTGDQILAAVADRLRSAAGPGDVVCRWGGDEFGVVLARASVAEIVDLAHRLVRGVRALAGAAEPGDPVSRIGLSVGVAPFTREVDPVAVLRAADTALYRSKTHPLDRVHVQPV